MATYPNVNAANKYARDVVSGKVSACLFVRQACKRHLDDLAASSKADFEFIFRKDKAERVCRFIQLLPHTKGKWAQLRLRIKLEPWQLFIVVCVFGWYQKNKKRVRRFREVYVEVPRKNGKSAITSGVGLFCFAADGEFGAEVYSGATTEKQAKEVFTPARLMCKNTPDLVNKFGINVFASNLSRPLDGSKFEPIIGNPGDGSSPSAALVDEYHEHPDDSLYTTMQTGMGSRDQPLMWTITTAGFDVSGPCYDKRREVLEMLKGSTPNDQLFGVIYTLDEGDDWTDINNLAKANPNLGVSVDEDYLANQLQRAKNNPRFVNRFKTKHLNLWVSSKTAFFNMENWSKCEDRSLKFEDFKTDDCVLSFDLAQKLDLVAMAPLFTRIIDDKRHYYSIDPRFFVPEDTVFNGDNRRLSEKYQGWVNSGHLFATDGAEIDYRDILSEALLANRFGNVIESPIDPHGSTNLSHNLDDENLNPVTIQQNFTNLSDGMKELEAAIESGRFHHDGNPVMTDCILNVVGKYLAGSDDIVRPIKDHVDSKIDGAVSLIMGVGRSLAGAEKDPEPEIIIL